MTVVDSNLLLVWLEQVISFIIIHSKHQLRIVYTFTFPVLFTFPASRLKFCTFSTIILHIFHIIPILPHYSTLFKLIAHYSTVFNIIPRYSHYSYFTLCNFTVFPRSIFTYYVLHVLQLPLTF